jgi:restriction system protein
MARRGFFAELQHQLKQVEKEQARVERESERAHKASLREAERTRKAAERATKKLATAQAGELKRLEKEAKIAHVSKMEADVESRNLELAQVFDEIDSLLDATLDVDDYVDLDTLRKTAEHPHFDMKDLETPIPPPEPVPNFTPPAAPSGLKGLFGKKKHQLAVEEAAASHKRAAKEWDTAVCLHAELESERVSKLKKEKSRYASECALREVEVEENNKAVDKLKTDLSYGSNDAVQEYVSIVLGNSVYPEHFPISHEFEFETSTAELQLRVLIPSPEIIPMTKAYKYKKSSDEITETKLSQKVCKDRYSEAICQVALRSIHEIFEADRLGLIKTISLEVGTITIVPSTGINDFILFIATGAERESFLQYDLSNVTPSATLEHLGASISKNPFGLVPTDSSGIRRS